MCRSSPAAISTNIGYWNWYARAHRHKTSAEKVTIPGRKQVFRARNAAGSFYADTVALLEESVATASRDFRPVPDTVVPMLETYFTDGRRVGERSSLSAARERFIESFARLDNRYKDLERPDAYPVRISAALNALLNSEKIRAERRQG